MPNLAFGIYRLLPRAAIVVGTSKSGLVNTSTSCPLGMAAWIGGQGALTNIVLDRAVQTRGHAEYTLFQLLRRVLNLGINPGGWDSMREAMVDSTT